MAPSQFTSAEVLVLVILQPHTGKEPEVVKVMNTQPQEMTGWTVSLAAPTAVTIRIINTHKGQASV